MLIDREFSYTDCCVTYLGTATVEISRRRLHDHNDPGWQPEATVCFVRVRSAAVTSEHGVFHLMPDPRYGFARDDAWLCGKLERDRGWCEAAVAAAQDEGDAITKG